MCLLQWISREKFSLKLGEHRFQQNLPSVLPLSSVADPNDVHTAGVTLISSSGWTEKLSGKQQLLSWWWWWQFPPDPLPPASTWQYLQVGGEVIRGRTPDSKLLSCYIWFHLAWLGLFSPEHTEMQLGQEDMGNAGCWATVRENQGPFPETTVPLTSLTRPEH